MTLGLSLFLASVDTFAVIETGCKGIKKFHDAICKVRVFYRFLREVLGDLYEDLAYLSAVGRSSTNCCMIVQRPLEDEGERKNWLTDTGEKRKR